MKAQHLPFCYQHKLAVINQSAKNLRKLKFLLPLLLLTACTGAPKDDGSTPPSL